MPFSEEHISSVNRAQAISESDSFTQARYCQMFRHFPARVRNVLDVGCNTGRGGAVLKSLDPGIEITGLDCVPERLGMMDPKVYFKALCGFSHAIPVEDSIFDSVVGGEFIEHVPAVQIEPTLAEFFRILRLRGRLILTTPNPGYLKNKFKGLSVLEDQSHLSQHHPDCLAWRMRQIGFSSVRIFGSGRVSSLIGERIPFLPLYGSYLIRGDKW